MSTNTVTCNFTKQYNIGEGTHIGDTAGTWRIPDAQFNFGSVVYDVNAPEYFVSYFEFTTPYFEGTCANINIRLVIHSDTVQTPIRFAICKSTANRDKYRKTHSSVSDENQIVSDILQVVPQKNPSSNNGKIADLLINTTKIEPNTTYYLFLWAAEAVANKSCNVQSHGAYLNQHLVTITVFENVAYIDNGSEMKPHKCFIDTGSEWLPIIPYIDDGSSWIPCK